MSLEFFNFTELPWLLGFVVTYLLLSFTIFKTRLSVKCFELLVVILLSICLLDPKLTEQQEQQGLLVAIDSSLSISSDAYNGWKEQLAEITNLSPGLKLNYVNFAEKVSSISQEFSAKKSTNLGQLTNYQELISSYPDLPIVLLSDGRETSGNVISSISSNELNSPPVYPMLLNVDQSSREVNWQLVDLPLIADSGSSEEVSLIITNSKNTPFKGMLKLYENNELIKEEAVTISADTSASFNLTTNSLKVGLNNFTLELEDYNNQTIKKSEFFITAKQKTKILLLSNNSAEERQILNILKSIGYRVEAKIATEYQETVNSQNHSLVILNNVPHKLLNKQLAADIPKYVEEGGAMLMIGGNQSFGLGGYLNTDIAEVLPVTLTPPQKVQKRLNVAVQLVLDKSGSMKNSSKIDYTRLAAKAVLDALKDDDYFGLIGFDNQPFVAYRLRQLKQGQRLDAARRVNLLFPNGGTNLYPALDLAKRELEGAAAGRKHIIVLTDGQLPDAAVSGANYLNLARNTKATKISISTFLIGGDDSTLLREIAQFGGGKYHRTIDSRTLPKLFLEDVKVNTADKTQQEFDKYEVQPAANSQQKAYLKLNNIPPVDGYVETKLKEQASLDLFTSTRNNDPILASWKYGLGKAAALTTDASGRWTQSWLNWSESGSLWAAILENLITGKDQNKFSDFDLNFHQKGDSITFNLNIYQENFSASDFSLDFSPVVNNNNKNQLLNFTQSSKGRYKALAQINEAGFYNLTLNAPGNQQYQFKIYLRNPLELEKQAGSDPAFLSALAYLTGGEINPTQEKLLNSISVANKTKEYPLFNYLIFISLLSLLISIFLRRS